MSEEKQGSFESVGYVLDSVQKLPSMPSIVMEVLESFGNENLSVNTLANKIGRDQAIVARVLRVANAPFFGKSGQVSSISEAISLLGFSHLRGLVAAASIINVFPYTGNVIDMPAFWRHGIGTADCAKVLARHVGLNPEIAFTAGLLHDIGKLVMSVYFPLTFAHVHKTVSGSTIDSLRAESAAFGLDHAAIGGEVAKRWNFPIEIRKAVELHHTEYVASDDITLSDVIYVANLFAKTLDDGNLRKPETEHLIVSADLRLKFKLDKMEELLIEAKRQYDSDITLING